MNYSVVEYLGESNDGKCGYCKQTGSYNSTGFWAHTMNCFDYQSLINRNWRRSGQYCYLPRNNDTCCPLYTIKCDAMDFKLHRSHKKVLKNMNKFLRDGDKDKNYLKSHEGAGTSEEIKPSKEHSDVKLDGINVASISHESEPKAVKPLTPKKEKIIAKVAESKISIGDCDKPPNPKKAKLIRLERKKQKLAAKGQTLDDVKPRKRGNVEKSLEDFLAEEPKDGKHRLEVKLIPSKEGTGAIAFTLYKKYQMQIHKDSPSKLTLRSYERFLVNTPMTKAKLVSVSTAEATNINLSFNLFRKYELSIHKSTDSEFSDYVQFLVTSPLQTMKDPSTPPEGFGSFHYQYYLDGVLIAVGVIDILPECVSSVYFYYDPEYSFLSLGTYASLREIALVRELSKTSVQLTNYYLGFYIPTCPKMRYKANVKPSYLLCPEVFTWHLLDEKLSNEIDAVSYLRINKTEEDKEKVTDEDDLKTVLVLFNRTAMKYGDYRRLVATKRIPIDDFSEVMGYAKIVGRSISQKMLLYRTLN